MRQMSEEREILYRLRKRQEDGTDKIVGIEKHEGGKIFHQNIHTKNRYWFNILGKGFAGESSHPCYIKHTSKDQYTGIDVDGVKLFERDKVIGGDLEGVVVFEDGGFVVHFEHASCYLSNDNKLKITGVQGVKDDRQA